MTQATHTQLQVQSTPLLGNQAGVVIVEHLIVFMPVFFFILATVQTVEVCSGMILLRHAAFCAARAAIVVLPDDPRRYRNEVSVKLEDAKGKTPAHYVIYEKSSGVTAVKKAAQMILQTDRHFDMSKLAIELKIDPNSNELSAKLAVPYRCYARFVNAACTGKDAITLKAEGLNTYQGARYAY